MAAIPAYTSNQYKIVSRQLIIKMLLLVLIVIQLTALIVNFTFSGHLLRNSFYYSCSSAYHSQQRDNNPSQDEMITNNNNSSVHFFINGTDYGGVDRYTSYATHKDENDVTSFRYPIDIGPCRINEKNKTSLFVGVVSAPGNFKRRRFIRRTWLRHLNNQREKMNVVGFGFVIGKTTNAVVQLRIEEESLAHGDILQVQMIDNYYDLAVKGVAFLNWLNNNCKTVDYILKVDDDVYVNVHNLTSVVAGLLTDVISVYGFYLSSPFVKRGDPLLLFE